MLLAKFVELIKQTNASTDGKAFPWSNDAIEQYLGWAFARNYLFGHMEDGKVDGMAVIYPSYFSYNGDPKNLLPSDHEVPKTDERFLEIVIMDCIFNSEKARISITKQMFERYPNWKNQTKFAVRKGIVKKMPNRYFELTAGLQL